VPENSNFKLGLEQFQTWAGGEVRSYKPRSGRKNAAPALEVAEKACLAAFSRAASRVE